VLTHALVNVFLPSMQGTKVGFMRDILSETKSCLKQNEVSHMEMPCYHEISVKNLYADAMKDELLARYLPSKEKLSGRLPERDFFFVFLFTLRNKYMREIIADAQKARYTVDEGASGEKGIAISDA
jgi:hypothetical protein